MRKGRVRLTIQHDETAILNCLDGTGEEIGGERSEILEDKYSVGVTEDLYRDFVVSVEYDQGVSRGEEDFTYVYRTSVAVAKISNGFYTFGSCMILPFTFAAPFSWLGLFNLLELGRWFYFELGTLHGLIEKKQSWTCPRFSIASMLWDLE